MDKSLKKFLDRLHMTKPTLAIVEKKPLRLVLPYLGPISLNAMKNTLNCCKLPVIFKS